ncbi:endonuclease Q family protein, partial [Paenibacillus sepulcri]|nr:endonuclease Q family protein [Paenibacillus sepulcri]
IEQLAAQAGREKPFVPENRPPYVYQVPLEFIPGVGKRAMDKLLARFGTEMQILHDAPITDIAETAGEAAAEVIAASRTGKLVLQAGGGGRYGRVAKP